MATSEAPTSEHAPGGDDFAASYYTTAHLGGDDDYSWENERWRDFFMSVADRAIALTNPSSVLDVGCATGMLVQAFVTHGVEAEGIDVSEYAVSHAHADVSGRLRVASATEPLDGRWDLVTCVEVLEHMSPDEAQTAIDNICGATDRVLFSSTPSDFAEATHVNVQPTADWAAWFAERGFFRRADANVSFLTPWAVLFERGDLTPREVTHRYESVLIPLQSEVREKRSALLDLDRQLSRLQGDGGTPAGASDRGDELALTREQLLAARHDVLTTRDHIIGLEAENARLIKELGRAEWVVRRLQKRKKLQGQRIKQLRQQLDNRRQETRKLREQQADLRRRTAAADRELAEVRGSRSWRAGRALTAPLRLFRR